MITEKETIVETAVLVPPHKRICWSAIVTGALVGVGLSFLLNLFATSIGLSAYSMPTDGIATLAVGGLIGMIIAIFVAMGLAGYTAGYLGRAYCPLRNHGILYGFLTWTLALLISAVVTAHVTQYVQNYAANATHAVIVPNNTANTPAVVVTNKPEPSSAILNTKVHVGMTPEQLAWGTFLIFVLFFVGAFASCLGAHWGMNCKRVD